MSRPAVAIPEKLFFKIGEVCDLAGVQAHVLRYWESEFPMLAPQKNRAGQRVYRKRDVEMALRIKELLYEDQYTIAGAKKRLTNELRGGGKLKVVGNDEDDAASTSLSSSSSSLASSSTSLASTSSSQAPSGGNSSAVNSSGVNSPAANSSAMISEPDLFSDNEAISSPPPPPADYVRSAPRSAEERQGLKQLAAELREILSLLEQENQGRAK